MSKRSSQSLFISFGIALVSIVATLLVLEGGFRLFYFRLSHRGDPTQYLFDRTLYWYPRPGQTVREVTINRLGLRGPETKEKDPSRFRLLAVGDSFTYGYRVSNAESWPLQLGALLDREGARHPGDGRPIEVLNGGVTGWGVFQMDRYARRAIPRFEPDVVMLVIAPVDVFRQPFREEKDLDAYLEQEEWMRAIKPSMLLTYVARQAQKRGLGKPWNERFTMSDDPEPLWAADAERIRMLVADFSGKTRFILGVMQDFSHVRDWVAPRVLALARELGVDAFDIAPALAGIDPREVTIRWDSHLNANGYAQTARTVADLLYSRNLVARPSGDVIEARTSPLAP